jgi:hypothetical protein
MSEPRPDPLGVSTGQGIRLVGMTLANFQTPPDHRTGELDLIDLPMEAAEP